MLRRSEGPAHLTWRHNEGTVADHWKRPNVIHPFIRRSALEIFNGLRQLDGSEEIRPAWVQSLTKNKKGAAKVSSGAGGGGDVVVPGSQSIPMDVNRFDGGITFMLPVDTNIVEGDVVKFEFAYTVRRGSPWSNHSEADFDISAGDLHVEVNGGKIVETESTT